MVSVTASLSLIKRNKYLCLKGQGQNKNEAWDKDNLRNDQFGFCILPRNRTLMKVTDIFLGTYSEKGKSLWKKRDFSRTSFPTDKFLELALCCSNVKGRT